MRHAINLALQARGQTHPNPLVGAVIVAANGQLLAEGWHARDGGPHAEIVALSKLQKGEQSPLQRSDKSAPAATPATIPANTPAPATTIPADASVSISAPTDADLSQATLYVTLEPCSTHGRTGACTDAIIRSGIGRVVIGAIDPYPRHGGNAVAVLQKAGIEVTCGVLADECTDLNLIFNHRITHTQPLIAAKIAVTLDGKIATREHHSRWITGQVARADVMRWRRYFPAIGVGVGTLLADNPSLTARPLPQQENTADAANADAIDTRPAHTDAAVDATDADAAVDANAIGIYPAHADAVFCPRRLIFDRNGQSWQRAEATVFTDAFAHRTLILTSEGAAAERLEPLRQAGIAIAVLPQADFKYENFGNALRKLLTAEGLSGLYVEGGGGLLSHLLAAQALDYLFCYRAPKLLADAQALSPFSGQHTGNMADAITLRNVRHAILGDDQLMRGHIIYP